MEDRAMPRSRTPRKPPVPKSLAATSPTTNRSSRKSPTKVQHLKPNPSQNLAKTRRLTWIKSILNTTESAISTKIATSTASFRNTKFL